MINLNRGVSTPIALTIIIILAVILVSGIFACQYYTAQEETKMPEIKASETPKDKTADWKIYRNEEYGFEFKYPANWVISDEYSGLVNIISPEHKIDFSVSYCDSVCWEHKKQEWNVDTIKDFINLHSGILE